MIRWICTGNHVSRRPHYAVHHLTRDPSSRASPDACYPPPGTVWLSARVPYLTAVCQRPYPDRDCGLPVVLTLQCVPHRPCVSHWESGYPYRSRWSALRRCVDHRLDALAHALLGRFTPSGPICLWLVPHPLELCHPGGNAPSQTRH